MSRSLAIQGRTAYCRALVLAMTLLSVSTIQAAAPGQGTNSRAAREDATHSIPIDKLDRDAQAKVKAVIGRPTIFRRLPTQVTDCDPDMYLFLVRHPEIITDIWETMGISNCKLTRVNANTFKASDGAGSTGTVKVLFSNHDTQVIYADGAYDGPMFDKPIKAHCVMVLKSAYITETNGRNYVTSRLDTFIQIDNLGVELLAKTFQSLITQSADYNFAETSAFLGNVSHTAETNPAGMGRLASQLKHVDDETKEKLADLSQRVAEKPTAKRVAQAPVAQKKKK